MCQSKHYMSAPRTQNVSILCLLDEGTFQCSKSRQVMSSSKLVNVTVFILINVPSLINAPLPNILRVKGDQMPSKYWLQDTKTSYICPKLSQERHF